MTVRSSLLPGFVVAIVLVTVFSLKLGLLPAGGYVPLDVDPVRWLTFTIMPAAALSLEAAAAIARQLRTSLVGTLQENFVTGSVMRG
ncbi:ABC transporter permease, partial [Streptomyces daliensis]|nr:ABC transporter permease [Streptomyces daliensis]